MRQLNQGASRKMRSTSWETVKKIASFHIRDIAQLPHSQLAVLVVGWFIFAITRTSTIYSAVLQNQSSKSVASRWFFTFMQDQLSVQALGIQYLSVITWCILVAFIAKMAGVVYLMQLNYRGLSESDAVKSVLQLLSIFFWLDTQMVVVVLVNFSIEMMLDLGSTTVFVGVAILLLLPVELALNNILTYDFGYFRSNLVQGRNYAYATICSVFAMVSSLAFYVSRKHPSSTGQIMINLLHLFFALVQITLRLKWDVHFYNPTANRISVAFEAFYLWMVVSNCFGVCIPSITDVLDFDYLTLLLFPLSCWIVFNLLKWRSKIVLTSPWNTKSKRTMGESLYFFERLYYAFLNQHLDENKGYLYSRMTEHSRLCADPCCLCYLNRIPYDLSIGHLQSMHARDIYHMFSKSKSGKKENTLTFFDDEVAIQAMKLKHNSVIGIKMDDSTNRIHIYNDHHILKKNIDFIMNLESQEDFTKVMGAFLRGLVTKKQSTKQYSAVIANLAFLHSEYKNPMAVLLLAYDYIYSQNYMMEANLLRHAILLNFIAMAKKNMQAGEYLTFGSTTGLETVSLAEVLNFRNRVHDLKFAVHGLILKKIDLYANLSQKVINFDDVTILGDDTYSKAVRAQLEVDALINISKTNSKLAKLGVLFEMAVLERAAVSSKMRKCYKEAYLETKNRVGSISSISSKFKFSPFNNSNVAVFVRNFDGTFRICKYTNNANHLFGVATDELNGLKISNFMPKNIAKEHDRFIMSFLNGQSLNRHKGKLYVPVLNRNGFMRSTMMFIKPEFQFFNEIYVAALVSVRKKNHFPIMYTDLSGKLLGSNKQALKVLANNSKLDESALFPMFPRLFQYYYPEIKSIDPGLQKSQVLNPNNVPEHAETTFGDETFADKDEYNVEANGELRGKEHFDLFLFQMLYKTLTSATDTESPLTKTMGTMGDSSGYTTDQVQARIKKSSNKQLNQLMDASVALQFEYLSKIISQQRKQILDNLSKIYKAKVVIESNHFQQQITLREITLDSIHKTRMRVQQFFKAFAVNNNPYLMEILMVSPESLNNLYKLCSYRVKLRDLKQEAGMEVDDNEVGKPKSALKTKTLAPTGNKTDRPLNQTETHGNNGTLTLGEGVVTFERLSSVANVSPEDMALVEAIEQPYQHKDNHQSLPNYKAAMKPSPGVGYDDEHLLSVVQKAPEEIKIAGGAKKEKNEKLGLLKEKINKFGHMINSVKKELERDLDHSKIQRLADLIYGSLVSNADQKDFFASMQSLFNRGGSQHSSRESGFADSEFIEGKSLEIEDSVSSGQDSNLEVRVEYTDPLKSRVATDQPSTFLNSSSKMSVKTSQDANLIRNSIQKSQWKLKFRKIEYAMYALCIICLGLKIVFKMTYDNALLKVYNYAVSVNLMSNLLRPTGFIYKESIKGWLQQFYNFDLSQLPNHMIFYPNQLVYYQTRLLLQVQDLITFFMDGLSIDFSFMSGLPSMPISIFATIFNLINDYLRVIYVIKNQVNQDDPTFITDNLPLWNEIRNLSREIFIMLYHNFLNQDSSRSSKLAQLYLYFGLNYSMNALIIALMTFGTMYICHLLHEQLSQAADIFLRIDKWLFSNALKKLSRISSIDSEEGNDLKISVMEHMRNHSKVLETDANLVGGGKTVAAKKTKKSMLKKSSNALTDSVVTRNYSHLRGFPEKDFKMVGLFTLIVYLVVSLPSFVNMILLLNYYSTLDASLQTSSNINLCSASSYYLAGIQYRIYVDQAVPEAPRMDPTLIPLGKELDSNIENAKNIPDAYFQQILTTTYVCQTTGESTRDKSQEQLCLHSSSTGKDYTALSAIYELTQDAKLLNAQLEKASMDTFVRYFQSTDFSFYDLKGVFLTVTLKVIASDYMNRILQFISSMKGVTNGLLAVFSLLLPFSLALYHWVWLPYRLRHWRRYQNTLLVLNDDVINCIYIKSYFGQDSAL